jgi:hypothetical protein
MNEVTIPLKISGIAQMKAELKELKNEIASASDPAQMAALSQKAEELADKLKGANEQAAEFSGSKFESVSYSLKGIKKELASLDFEGAEKKSKVFAKTLGSINPKDIAKGFKGFAGMLGTLGNAFIKLGVTILMNPIFLLVTVIAAVVVAVGMFLNKLGVLTAAMGAIKAPFKAVVQGFKDLTDWMGITDNAAEKNARVARENAMAHVAANDKIMASSKERQDLQTAQYNREIAESKARGENTYYLEWAQTAAIQNASYERITIARESIKKLDRLNDAASVKKHNKLVEEINKDLEINRDAASALEVLAINEGKRRNEEADKKEKIAADKAKAARDKRLEADKASEAEIAAARKIVSDSTKTAQQIELDDLAANYKKKIAEAVKYKNDTTALVEAQKVQEAAIIKKYDDAAKAAEAASHAANIAKIDAYNLELAALTDTEEQKLYDKYEADKIKFADNELALFNLSKKYAEDTTALKKAEADKQKAIDDAALKAKKSIIASEIDAAKGLVNLLGGLGEKNKKIQKAALIANAALSIAEIINNTNVGSAKEVATKGVIGLGTSALLYTKMAISIASVVAATSKGLSALGGGSVTPPSNTGEGGGGGGDTSTTAVAPVSGPNLFGQANTGSQVNAGGNSNQNITVTAIVSETEITASQQHINNIQQNSVL